MIKAVVFDLDHTLFDRHGTLKYLVPSLRKEFSVNEKMTDEEIGNLWCYADDSFVYSGWENIWGYLSDKGVFSVTPPFEDYCAFYINILPVQPFLFRKRCPCLKNSEVSGIKRHLLQTDIMSCSTAK